jgi:hypothetical protein
VLRLAALGVPALTISGPAAADSIWATVAARVPAEREPTAVKWQSWLVPSALAYRPGAPPPRNSSRARLEMRELLDLQGRRTDAINAIIDFWGPQGGLPQWTAILLDKIQEKGVNPVRASRALALMHTAIADATICAWDGKYFHRRLQPASVDRRLRPRSASDDRLASYPSEHAAVAGAASVVLTFLFPSQTAVVHGKRMTFDAIANEAATSRLWAGTNYRSDVEAGVRLGQAIGWLAVQRGNSDGSGAVWDATTQPGRLGVLTPPGPGATAPYWSPTPPANAFPPAEPLAGFWDPWLLEAPDQFRAPVPPGLQGTFPSTAYLAEVQEVKDAVANLTDAQKQIANYWANNPGVSATPPGEWMRVAAGLVKSAKVSTPRAARALALIGVGMADSAISCWDSKFAYWLMRPVTAIRTIEGQPFSDPAWNSFIPTPPFPAYTSGHSTFSGCAETVLEYLFPGGKAKNAAGQDVSFHDAAEEAALSRLLAGIHYRSDNEAGLVGGRGVGALVVQRAENDGAA